jgi:hypothetical protein
MMRPTIPITVPTISAVLKLLPFDEFEELVPVLGGEELEVGDFVAVEKEVNVARDCVPEGKTSKVVLATGWNNDVVIEDVVAIDVWAVPVCCSGPKGPKRWRVNSVLRIHQVGVIVAPK